MPQYNATRLTSFKRMFLVDEPLYNRLFANYKELSQTTDGPGPGNETQETNVEAEGGGGGGGGTDGGTGEEYVVPVNDADNDNATTAPPTSSSQQELPHSNDIFVETNPVVAATSTPAVEEQRGKRSILKVANEQEKDQIVDYIPSATATTPPTATESQEETAAPASNTPYQIREICKSTCRLCDQEITNLPELEKHYKENHQQQQQQQQENSQSSMFECKVCEAFYPNEETLNKHIRNVHENPRKRKYGSGELLDSEDEQLENLIEKSPIAVKPVKKKPKVAKEFPCKFCGRLFRTQRTASNHEKAVHPDMFNVDSETNVNSSSRPQRSSKRKINYADSDNSEVENMFTNKKRLAISKR